MTGSALLYRHITWRFAMTAEANLAAIDYRLAPEHPFPAALDDAAAAWRGLLDEGADPRHCAVIGDSAGGGLALALALRLRDEGGPLPAAVVRATLATVARQPALRRLSATARSRLEGMVQAEQQEEAGQCFPPVLVQLAQEFDGVAATVLARFVEQAHNR